MSRRKTAFVLPFWIYRMKKSENWPSSGEQIQPLNFFDERYKLTMEIDPEAAEYLPVITTEDLETKRERYRIFLGTWSRTVEGGHVRIEGVCDFSDEPGFLREGEEEVVVNFDAVKKSVEDIKQANKEYARLEIVGEIHTHPLFKEEMDDNLRPWIPSTGDVDAIVEEIKKGNIKADRPFIMAIAVPSPDRNGKTVYAYYRLVKRGEKYLLDRVLFRKG